MFLDNRKFLKLGIGLVLLMQFGYFVAYSNGVYSSGSLSWDSALYIQPWWLISKGVVWPFSTTLNAPFFGNHGELIMWPLGWVGFIFRSPFFLLVLQDLAVVLTELVTICWVYEIVFKSDNYGRFGNSFNKKLNIRKTFIFVTATLILLVDPWNYWALGADFHVEPIATLFLVLTARYIFHNNSRYKYSLILVLLCGQVATIWLVGLAFSVLLAGKGNAKALKIFGLSIVWYFLSGIFGADQSNTLTQGYGYLASPGKQSSTAGVITGALFHVNRAIEKIIHRWQDAWAYVSAPGFLGIISPWGFGVTSIILIVNITNNYRHGVFAFPGFQGMPIGFFMVVGFADTVMRFVSYQQARSLAKDRFRTRFALVLTAIMALISLGWAVVWIPQNRPNWVKVDSSAASTVDSILNKVPTSDEVIVSQGIAGKFATRKYIYPLRSLGCFPIKTSTVYLVITPNEGIETLTSSQTAAVLSQSIFDMGAQVIGSSNNIWFLRLSSSASSICFRDQSDMVGSFLSTDVGVPTIGFDKGNSFMYSGVSKSGYVVYGAYGRFKPGATIDANVTLASGTGIKVELWDDTTNTLLERIEPNFNGIQQTVSLQGVVPSELIGRPPQSNTGKFIFVAKPADGPTGDLIEIRVFTSGTAPVKVYNISYG